MDSQEIETYFRALDEELADRPIGKPVAQPPSSTCVNNMQFPAQNGYTIPPIRYPNPGLKDWAHKNLMYSYGSPRKRQSHSPDATFFAATAYLPINMR
jgi:hypothetical protein